jgi:hypothetical protein
LCRIDGLRGAHIVLPWRPELSAYQHEDEMTFQESERVKAVAGSDVRRGFGASANPYRALMRKLEAATRRGREQ